MNDPASLYRQAVEALNRGSWGSAFDLATRVLPVVPDHAGVHFVLGVAALQMNRMPVALRHLQRAVKLNPARPDYGAQLARALATGHLLREAVAAADAATAGAPEDALTLDTLGVVYTQANEHAKAAAVFRRAAERMPERASFRFNLATSLMFAGELDRAEAEYEACLSRDPAYWKAHLALSQLRRQTSQSNHLERLQKLLSEAGGDDGQMYVNLALSKEYEDLGDYASAFTHLSAGKAAGRTGRAYSPARDEEIFAALEQAFASAAEDPGNACDSAEPIFVVGMPRTGTTLVDRIISSHPRVHSAGELSNFGVLLKRMSGSRTRNLLDPDTVTRAAAVADWSSLGRAYVASTRPGTGHVPHFVDKLPHNFLYLGFIARALPNARIICLRRDPMDTCLSNFRQLFEQNSPYYDYSFDLLDTGRYYLGFDRLMAHWQRVLPGRILEVRYEDIVEDQEASTRMLLQFCGLPWDDTCLAFERNQAPVATASVVQVREPLYRSAMQRWKRYDEQLGALKALLAGAGIQVG
jgi:tetratricopeptide (TPR) repeat protein